jgi:hypothetical protein
MMQNKKFFLLDMIENQFTLNYMDDVQTIKLIKKIIYYARKV